MPLEGVAERGGDETFRDGSSLALDELVLGRLSWRRESRSLHYVN